MTMQLTDEQLSAVREFLVRQHTLIFDSDEVSLAVALGRRLWRDIHAHAAVQDLGRT
jgi:hypothetical protein